MKFSTLFGTVACLTAFSLPSLAQAGPDFEPLAGDEAEMMSAPSSEDGDFSENVALLPADAAEMSAYPLSATSSGGGQFKFSDEQLEKIYNLKNKLADETGPTKVELMKQKRHLKDLMTQPSLDRGAITATQDKINKLNTELSNSKLAFKMDLVDTFTPEQRQAIRYKSMKHGRGHHKHHGQGGPGGMRHKGR